jgi:hypothetical protein
LGEPMPPPLGGEQGVDMLFHALNMLLIAHKVKRRA